MSIALTTKRLYLNIPYGEREWAKDKGLEWDNDRKVWWLGKQRDPLEFRSYWAFLDGSKTYEDRELLKRKGCRYKKSVKNWYVPENLDIDDFVEWWPDDLKPFLIRERFSICEIYPGSSGQAEVYKAWDILHDSGFYAVKVYKTSAEGEFPTIVQQDAASAERKALQKLNEHPNILELVEEEFIEQTRQICLITPWAVGGDLQNLIGGSDDEKARHAYESLGQFIDLEQDYDEFFTEYGQDLALEDDEDIWLEDSDIMIGILEGLQYAHEQGIYHRDIKPRNILLFFSMDEASDEIEITPKICDFGAAKVLSSLNGVSDKNRTLVSVRTEAYRWHHDLQTNPEGNFKELKYQHTWDLVSWTVIAVEMMTDKNAQSPAEALEWLNTELVTQLDTELHALLLKAIAENPEERPSEISSFKERLIAVTERLRQGAQ